jgi:hypothetical protein
VQTVAIDPTEGLIRGRFLFWELRQKKRAARKPPLFSANSPSVLEEQFHSKSNAAVSGTRTDGVSTILD